ncbi:Cadherin domain-containing protein [Ekhidna lutea]|uniref:Cadherin domain-containing protein n=1 Tax=Ekhidna lutea TaxID=447679 RepID=A0A239JFY2_EKHLU|nr:cadherin repeat domain-containing protein [Ekhidna lutea]SNT04328.1 Cadherin domain-containing protein [Ekhidna lutea]
MKKYLVKFIVITLILSLISCETGEEDPGPDENQAPSIADQSFSVDENSPNGTVIGTVSASDPDGDDVTFSIIGDNDNFSLSSSGELTVQNSNALDFESTSSFEISVAVTDGELTEQAIVTISLNDVEEGNGTTGACEITSLNYGDGALTFTTNDDGHITSILDSYTDEETGATETEELKLTYSGGKAVSGEWLDNGSADSQLIFTYDGDRISKIVDSGTDYVDEYRFFYDQDRLSKVENWTSEDGSAMTLDNSELVSYSGDNVSSIEELDQGTASGTETFSYDTKQNPFYNDLASLIYFENLFWYVSVNNVTSITQTYVAGHGYSETFTYSYNADNYPTSVNILYEDAEPPNETSEETFSLAYNCQ